MHRKTSAQTLGSTYGSLGNASYCVKGKTPCITSDIACLRDTNLILVLTMEFTMTVLTFLSLSRTHCKDEVTGIFTKLRLVVTMS